MDYHSIHGHDVANYSTPLTHRVVTVSAADLLSPSPPGSPTTTTSEKPPADVPSATASTRFIPTGIAPLDAVLAGGATPGGVRRGQLTEIWGPPGSGKSTFGWLAAHALRDGHAVAWVDCFQPLCEERLSTIIGSQIEEESANHFSHYTCPSLAHFIAMLCPPPPARAVCVAAENDKDIAPVTLLVIDSLSALVNHAFPRVADPNSSRQKNNIAMANGRRGPTAHDKRTQVLQYVTAALERLAETRRIAVVVLTQCATRVQQGDRGGGGGGGDRGGNAGLAPSLSADVWNRGIAARVVLFRDWAWDGRAGRPVGGRFAGVQKCSGYAGGGGGGGGGGNTGGPGGDSTPDFAAVVAFDILEAGLVDVQDHYTVISPRRRRVRTVDSMHNKRKLGDAADADDNDNDNDYGWDDELTNSLPRMPPQWQGSEDILLGPEEEDDEEEEEEQEEDEEERNNAADMPITIPRRRSQSVADSEADSDL